MKLESDLDIIRNLALEVNQLLGIKKEIRADQNLLELGLNSLQVMKLVSKLKKAGITITFKELISEPYLSAWYELLNREAVHSINSDNSILENQDKTIPNMYEPFPLTDVQYAYWVGRQSGQYLGGNGCHGYMEINGQHIDIERLESAWAIIVQHHPMLRVKYTEDGQQQVLTASPFTAIAVHDLTTCSQDEVNQQLEAIRANTSHRLLAIDQGEVARLQLSLLPDGKTRLHFDIDLLVADVQSFQIILHDLAAAYTRQQKPKAPENWNFAKYLYDKKLANADEERYAEAYWKNRLATLPLGPKLPLSNNAALIQHEPKFTRREYFLEDTAWSKLQLIASRYNVTSAMVLLAAYAYTLNKWSSESRFLMNIPLFNRDTLSEELEHVVADFTTLLLLEVDSETQQSFLAFTKSLQQQFHQDMNYTAYSGVKIQRDLAKYHPDEKVFAPIVFSCNLGVPLINEEFKDAFGKIHYMISQTPQVWLDFQMFDMDGGLLCIWDGLDDIFPSGLLDDMFDLFIKTIHWLIEDEQHWLQHPAIETKAQIARRQVIEDSIVTDSAQCLHTSFFEIAKQQPYAIALIDGIDHHEITYKQLTLQAEQVAATLLHNGFKKGDRVAISLPRGLEQIQAILGVLAIGGCFVPVHVTQPSERYKKIMEKANVSFILTAAPYEAKYKNIDQVQVIKIEQTQQFGHVTLPKVDVNSSAYIIFTSGSTGEPKGVEISHKAAWNTITDINQKYNISMEDRILAVSSLDFDLSIYDIFGLLSVGGSIVLLSDDTARNADIWLKLVRHYHVTLWNSVPALLKMFLIEAESAKLICLDLRIIMLSGDWINLDIPDRLLKVAPRGLLVAMGGATEAAIWSNYYNVDHPLPASWRSIPYGRPLRNQFYRVIDVNGEDCPNWKAGELWIGGAGIAKGYVGEPQLTAERFIEEKGIRWYKTGDNGRFWHNGLIEFLGRNDSQVKVRGHRIELGEIESVMRSYEKVEDAVVTVRGEESQYLAAYIVSCSEKEQVQSIKNNKPMIDWSNIDQLKASGYFLKNVNENEYRYRLFKNYCTHLTTETICKILVRCGFPIEKDASYNRITIIEREKINSRYQSLIDQWFRFLEKNNIVSCDGPIIHNKQCLIVQNEESFHRLNKKQTTYINEFISTFFEKSYALLTGEIEPLELLLPHNVHTLEQLTDNLSDGNKQQEVFINLIQTVLNHRIERQAPLKILEIGTRHINTLQIVMKAFSTDELHYTATDESNYFLNRAQQIVGSQPNIHYKMLDINKCPISQGFVDGDYDVIVASHSLHRAAHIRNSLKHLKKLLKHGGLFIQLEMTENNSLQLVSTAFLEDGFTHYEDERAKTCLPLLSENDWLSVLTDEGFTNMTTQSIDTAFTQYLFVAQVERQSTLDFQLEPLYRYLEQRLPNYMIPQVIIQLEQLPITANGKVDRAALPIPQQEQADLAKKDFIAPTTSIELRLAQIWKEVLGQEAISIDDHYFELGGDSLLATQLSAKIKEQFAVKMSLEAIFNQPVFQQMALLLEELVHQKSNEDSEKKLPSIEPNEQDRFKPFPLTDVQQAYWLGRSGIYAYGDVSTHCYFEMDCSSLDHARVEQTWNRLIQHHDMMRAIILNDGQQQQVQEFVAYYSIASYNLTNLSAEQRKEQLTLVRSEMEHQTFIPSEWPLFDIRMSAINEQKTRIHISFDNIIFDGFSMFYLFKEWKRLYDDSSAKLQTLQTTFRDYILAYQKIRETEMYKRDIQYWHQRIDNMYPAPDLPLLDYKEDLSNCKFTRYEEKLSTEEWLVLKQLAAKMNLSPASLLIAAYAETLARWSSQPKLTINLTRFHRVLFEPDVDQLIGDFTSLNLLSIDMSKGESFLERARTVQKQLLQDLEHPYVSGVYVERALAKKWNRQMGIMMPFVFTSGLGLEKNNGSTTKTSYLGDIVYGLSQTPQVWLDHQVSEQKGELWLSWDAIEELFPQYLIRDMFEAYTRILKELARKEDLWQQPIRSLVCFPCQEQEGKLKGPDTAISDETLISLVEKQIAANPTNLAVISEEKNMTYEQLSHLTNHTAQAILAMDRTKGRLVAVVMEKGWEQIVAVLGIMKAGKAYLPIDCTTPIERMKFLLQEGEVQSIVTQAHVLKQLPFLNDYHVTVIDPEWAHQECFITSLELLSSDLAYVIYTSGSTGKPKGVMIDHRGAVNTIVDINDRLGVCAEDRILALSNLTFDLSVYDIFGLLAVGGAIVVPRAERIKDPVHWNELLQTQHISIWNTVPAFMQMLAQYTKNIEFFTYPTLRAVLLSGDWIPISLPSEIWEIAPKTQILGLGGATEASIWSNIFDIQTVDGNWKSIPYGKPLANQYYYILNDQMAACPVNVPGNLYIGGVGLAKGYWKNEERTNEQFLIHPMTKERLYATGDLGRYLPDGNIEFLGRADAQIKLNGYRVEIGEIDYHLAKLPCVKEAATIVHERNGTSILVAYVVLEDEQDGLNNEQFKQLLAQKLPHYMLPTIYKSIDKMPLSENGKVNRKFLQQLPLNEQELSKKYRAPYTEMQKDVAAIWEEILSYEQPGLDDDFFTCGGNSLMAIQMIGKIKEQFTIELSIQTLFTHTRLEQLAAYVEEQSVTMEEGAL
ncbi:amino acid adenylation domain-containing protein [Lysinibacillus sp. FSL W8-0953]|uniref:amino acid adenylation domain-containing protein n=1 Tax=Lysinibacillus sp. FSL W8-0953 TaxID=2954640 RepID=UPI0030F581B0